jgi:hypothetical protein
LARKGDRSAPEISEYRDRSTGARVYQITNHGSINHPTYFLQSSFLPSGDAILFTSYRTGNAQLFEAAFPGGEIRQLTDADPIHPFSPAIAPGGEKVLFVRTGSIWELDYRTLEERQIVKFDDAQLGECSLSANGEWITAAVKHGQLSGIVTGRRDGSEWRLIPFPRTVIHPQFHPLDDQWLIFAGDPAPRMFRVRRDGEAMECLHEHDNNEFIVHETFLGTTGDIVFTVWPFSLRRMSWETRQITTIADYNAWHIAANRAGTQVLCDTNHPDRGLHLIDVATGAPRLIALSESSNQGSQWKTSRYALAEDFAAARSAAKTQALSWMETSTDTVYGPQWTHPHPSFSFDETKVAFASDRSGHPQVYVVEIPE